jgi:hypothetical protein
MTSSLVRADLQVTRSLLLIYVSTGIPTIPCQGMYPAIDGTGATGEDNGIMVQGYGERWASNDYRQEGETAMTSLHVEGAVETPRAFSFTDLASLPGQVPDIGRLIPGRQGGGVWLRSLLDATGARPQASHLTLHASDGDFSASVPLEAVRDRAIVVYRFGEGPLPAAQGGPMRFFITHIEACAVGEVDACANVKFLGTIQLTVGPGADTRPSSVRDHEALHQQAGHEHLPERS